jgi:ribose 5-phosphate isomerase A
MTRFASNSAAQNQPVNFKKEAAEYAVGFVKSGMRVGLGTGSTAIFATRRIAQLLREGSLTNLVGFATSKKVWEEGLKLGIPLADESMPEDIDLTIDGADEADPAMNLIKGGGGALLREKIVAQASRRVVIAIDDSKMSAQLGMRHSLPVELLSFGWRSQARFLEALGAQVAIRKDDKGSQFVTDSGNMIMDCDFGPIAEPGKLATAINERAGIVEHGLFIGLASDLVIAGPNGIQHMVREAIR